MYCARASAAIASSPLVAERSSDLALSHNGSPDEEESAVCSGGVAAVSGVAVLNLSRITLALGGCIPVAEKAFNTNVSVKYSHMPSRIARRGHSSLWVPIPEFSECEGQAAWCSFVREA